MYPSNLNGLPNWKLLKNHLAAEGQITKECFIKLIDDTIKILSNVFV